MAENTQNPQNNTPPSENTDILGDFTASEIPFSEEKEKTGTILDNLIITPEDEEKAREKKLAASLSGDTNENIAENRKIIDINFESLSDIILYLEQKNYDFVTLEPKETDVEVIFRENNIIKETKFIKFPAYTSILLKTKQVSELVIEDSKNQQDGKGKIQIGNDNYALITRTAPSTF